MKLTGAQALIKSLESEGVEVMFGLPGGCILPAYDPIIDSPIRHILVRHEQGRGAHGRGLRPRHRPAGRGHGDERPGRHQPGHAALRCLHGLDPDDRHHRPGLAARHRHRRLSGVRHRRHHPVGDQAQRARDGPERHPADRPPGVPHRHDRATGPGADRCAQGRPAGQHGLELADRPGRGVVAAGLRAADQGRPPADPGSGPVDRREPPAGHLRRRRDPEGPGRRHPEDPGRADRHLRRHHAHGPRRFSRRPSALPRHAGDARQLHRHHRHAERRPAHRPREPL